MRKTSCKTSGILTEKGASVLFFGFHSIFAILEPSGKGFPLPGTPARISVDHRGIGDLHFQQLFSLTDGHYLPVLVPPEFRECESIGNAQCVLVLRRDGQRHQNREKYSNEYALP